MQLQLLISIFPLLSAALVSAIPPPIAPIPYVLPPIQNMTWRGSVERGGPNITITGAPEDIIAAIKHANPYWLREGLYKDGIASAAVTAHWHNTLERRGRVSNWCNSAYYGQALTPKIFNGINYIMNHYGEGECGVNGVACGRFSCSYDSAILMCHNEAGLTYTPCVQLALNAHFLYETCGAGGNTYGFNGQAFYEDPTYNVLIKHTGAGNSC